MNKTEYKFALNKNMELSDKYTEIIRFAEMLLRKRIDFKIEKLYDGHRVGVYWKGVEIGDAIEHCGSYGTEENLIEIRGFHTNDDVIGYLTAEEAFELAEKALEWYNTPSDV